MKKYYNSQNIYFIQYRSDLPIKIGFTKNWADRKSSATTWAPYKILLIDIIRGDRHSERLIHNRFKDSRTHGEWFNPTPELLEFIKKAPRDDIDSLDKHTKTWVYKAPESKTNDIKDDIFGT